MKSESVRRYLASLGVCLERGGNRSWVSYPSTDPSDKLHLDTLAATRRHWDLVAGRAVDRLCIAKEMVRESRKLSAKDQRHFASWMKGKVTSIPTALLQTKISYSFPHSTWLTVAQNLATAHGSISAVKTQEIYKMALSGVDSLDTIANNACA